MTKFRNLSEATGVNNPTELTHFINSTYRKIDKAASKPTDFVTLDYLGKDSFGHDFFKGTDADGSVCFYIGKKGDEFE